MEQAVVEAETRLVASLPMSEILADAGWNCRGNIAPMDVVDLAKDIETHGLIQPVIVAPLEGDAEHKYKLIAGYRRFKAHTIIKRLNIDCIVRNDMVDEKRARIFNLSENLQRKDLNILQEAKAIQRLVSLGIPNNTIANEINQSYGWVQVRAMLLKFPELVKNEIAQGYIPQAQIRELSTIYDESGAEPVFTAVRKLKEARERGEKKTSVELRPKNNKQALIKRQRKRPEISKLMGELQDAIGNGLHTRVLAWTVGEISDFDIYTDIKAKADELDKPYHIPDWITQ